MTTPAEPARCRVCNCPLAIAAPAPPGLDRCGDCERKAGCVRFGDGRLYRPVVDPEKPWAPRFKPVGR